MRGSWARVLSITPPPRPVANPRWSPPARCARPRRRPRPARRPGGRRPTARDGARYVAGSRPRRRRRREWGRCQRWASSRRWRSRPWRRSLSPARHPRRRHPGGNGNRATRAQVPPSSTSGSTRSKKKIDNREQKLQRGCSPSNQEALSDRINEVEGTASRSAGRRVARTPSPARGGIEPRKSVRAPNGTSRKLTGASGSSRAAGGLGRAALEPSVGRSPARFPAETRRAGPVPCRPPLPTGSRSSLLVAALAALVLIIAALARPRRRWLWPRSPCSAPYLIGRGCRSAIRLAARAGAEHPATTITFAADPAPERVPRRRRPRPFRFHGQVPVPVAVSVAAGQVTLSGGAGPRRPLRAPARARPPLLVTEG